MSQENQKKPIFSPRQRKVGRFLLGFISVILFLHLTLYFASDLLLRRYIQNQVEMMSEGKYTVDFDRFNLSLLERGFYVRNFTLYPLEEGAIDDEEFAIHRVHVPEFSIKNIGYRFGERTLVLGTIRLSEPMVQSRLEEREGEDRRPLRLLEEEIRKSIGNNLNEIIIRDLYVANADLLLENFISQQSIKAEKTQFHVTNIRLLTPREVATPFNAEGFDFQIENFELLLADSIHTIKAQYVDVSTIEHYIRGQNVRLVPDVTTHSDIYYEVELDNLELTDADINKVFYTSEVEVGDLSLMKPSFSIYSDVVTTDEGAIEYDLYPLIQDLLSSITVQNLNIYEGSYLQRSIRDSQRNRVEAASINFKMDQVYIGPDEEKKRNQFFHAQDAELDIAHVRIALADGVHWITGEKVLLSSFEDIIEITGVSVAPVYDENEIPQITLVEIEVPSLSLREANLKKIYNENIVDIKEMVLQSPSVLLRDVRAGDGGQPLDQGSLQELTREFLRAIYIERLEMQDGTLVLDNRLRVRQDSLSFGKINFVLENFRLDDQVDAESSRIFFAEELQLEVEDYALKLADNLHLFSSDRIFLNTKTDFLRISNFRFRPADPENIQTILDRYGRNAVLDIEIPEFYARGIDFPRAYFGNELYVREIEVPSPVIKVNQYRKREGENDEVKVDRGDIFELLTAYFSVIQVDSLNLISGTWEYENLGEDKIRTFAEDNVSIRVKNFYLDQYSDQQDLQSLFAEELDISLDNYVFNIAEGQYSIVADKISFNTAKEEILTSNVSLRPRSDLPAKVAISADIPEMRFVGVDLETFIFDNALILQKVKLSNSDVRLFINREEEQRDVGNGLGRRARDRNLPRTIDLVQIDTIDTENSHINVAYREKGLSRELIDTGISLKFFDFLLDSAKLAQGDIAAFFGNLELEIDDFSLVLQDSIHSVNFSQVNLNTSNEEIIFRDFAIIPANYMGQQDMPVISAFVPKVTMKTESLRELQHTGDFIVSNLELHDPEIAVYLDRQRKPNSSSVNKAEQAFQNFLSTLYVGQFRIHRGSIAMREKGSRDEIQSFSNLGLVLNELNFDLTSEGGLDTKMFLDSDFEVVIPNYEIDLKDGMNKVRVGLATLTSKDLVLENVSLFPKFGKYHYHRLVGYQTDVTSIDIPRVVFEGIDLNEFVENNSFRATKLHVHQPDAEIFRDKRYEMLIEHKPMPQVLIMNAGLDLLVDSLVVYGGNVHYFEFPEKGMVPGNIHFNKINLSLAPFQLSEDPSAFQLKSTFFSAEGFMNGEAPMAISGEMVYSGRYPIHVEAEIGEFELGLINPILQANAFAKVRRGVIREAKWHFTADSVQAVGEMTVKYNNLNLRLLDERTLEPGGGRKRMLSFVINAIAVRSNNPRKFFNRLVSSNIYEKRENHRFLFNYWWRATVSGLKGSVGLGEPKIPKGLAEEE